MTVTFFVSKLVKVRELASVLCEARPFVWDIELAPADCNGFLLLKMRAADFVGTAPFRLLRRTL